MSVLACLVKTMELVWIWLMATTVRVQMGLLAMTVKQVCCIFKKLTYLEEVIIIYIWLITMSIEVL